MASMKNHLLNTLMFIVLVLTFANNIQTTPIATQWPEVDSVDLSIDFGPDANSFKLTCNIKFPNATPYHHSIEFDVGTEEIGNYFYLQGNELIFDPKFVRLLFC